MVSAAKLAANRANATRSTGPKTPAGKRRSSLNATTHGLRSANPRPTLPGEDPAAFDAFRAQTRRDLRPATAPESALADRAAALLWRLSRLPSVEQTLAQFQLNRREANHDNEQLGYRPKDREPFAPPAPHVLLADYFYHRDDPANPIARLQRYETTLTRTLQRTLADLRALQKDRRDNPPPDDDDETEDDAPADQPDLPTEPATPELPNEPTATPAAPDAPTRGTGDPPVSPSTPTTAGLPNEPTATPQDAPPPPRDAGVSPAQPPTAPPIQNEPNPPPPSSVSIGAPSAANPSPPLPDPQSPIAKTPKTGTPATVPALSE